MRRFILKSFLLFSASIIGYSTIFVFYKIKLENKISESQTIILGDSHTEYIDLPNTFNYSIHGAPYITHFNFARTFIEHIKNKKVIISFNFNNISNTYENRFRNHKIDAGWWVSKVNRDLHSINIYNRSFNYQWCDNSIKHMFTKYKLIFINNLISNETLLNVATSRCDTITQNITLEKHFTNPDYIYKDVIQRKYLDLLIEMLKNNNCQIFFLTTPVTDYYLNHVPDELKNEYCRIIKHYNVKLIDLNSGFEKHMDESYFRDADHLNLKGDSLVKEYLLRFFAIYNLE